jgi:hypothetical protein
MTSENTNLPNTIKYSIWQTRTDDNQLGTKKKSAHLKERTNLDTDIKGDHI